MIARSHTVHRFTHSPIKWKCSIDTCLPAGLELEIDIRHHAVLVHKTRPFSPSPARPASTRRVSHEAHAARFRLTISSSDNALHLGRSCLPINNMEEM